LTSPSRWREHLVAILSRTTQPETVSITMPIPSAHLSQILRGPSLQELILDDVRDVPNDGADLPPPSHVRALCTPAMEDRTPSARLVLGVPASCARPSLVACTLTLDMRSLEAHDLRALCQQLG
jgi:hypothetical protein